jgi:exfoliative toxin A/B
MERVIKKIPVPIAGLALALAATGNLLLSYGAIYRSIFGTLSALILLLFIIKVLFDLNDVLESLKNPVVASVLPTSTMCLMLLANYLKPYSPKIAFGLWIFGLLFHCFLILYFTVPDPVTGIEPIILIFQCFLCISSLL